MSRHTFTSCFVAIGVLAVVFAASGVAMGELLFSDNFNNAGTPVATDYGLNANLSSRLGGYFAPAMQSLAWGLDTWSSPGDIRVNETTPNWNGADQMVVKRTASSTDYAAFPYHGAIIQHNFNEDFIADGGWFSVRFDFDPVSLGSDAGSSTAVGGGVFIGAKDATCSTIPSTPYTQIPGRYDPNADLNIAFLGDGRVAATFHGNGGTASWSTFDDSPAAVGVEKIYSFELTVTLTDNSFAEDAYASANLKWLDNSGNWSSIDLNGTASGTDVTFQWDADENNYIGFYEQLHWPYNQYAVWDNISVNGEVPEPSTLALLACGLFGLLAYAWRKRK